jgi:hypothetical protein
MASISAQSEMEAPGASTTVSREQEAHVVGHTGATCDDCGGDHGVHAVVHYGATYMICDSCYDYACAAAESESEPEDFEDDSEGSGMPDADEYDYMMMADASGW